MCFLGASYLVDSGYGVWHVGAGTPIRDLRVYLGVVEGLLSRDYIRYIKRGYVGK